MSFYQPRAYCVRPTSVIPRPLVQQRFLKEAKDLVEAAPKPVLEKVTREAAAKAKEALRGRRRRGQRPSELTNPVK